MKSSGEGVVVGTSESTVSVVGLPLSSVPPSCMHSLGTDLLISARFSVDLHNFN